MLTVISDLHFAEETQDRVGDSDHGVGLTRNLGPEAFRLVIADLADKAQRARAKRFDLVLAGDIFDLHRTRLWFLGADAQVRPYVSCSDVTAGSPLETKALAILEAIAAEPRVATSLEVLRTLAAGRHAPDPDDPATLVDFPAAVELHFLPGNHDRLVNATPALRSRVRSLLGMPASDARFPHEIRPANDDPRVLVRHGHEYDADNFSVDVGATGSLGAIPESAYDAPAFGDCVTVDVATRLPHLFRQHVGDAAVVPGSPEGEIYRRLLEFDDVRPQSALLEFLLRIPGSTLSESAIWKRLEPVARALHDELRDNEFFQSRLSGGWRLLFNPLLVGVARRTGLPLPVVKGLRKCLPRDAGARPELRAAREPLLLDGSARFVVAGHTHEPQVAHLGVVKGEDRYFVDTGTWRRRLLADPSRSSFGSLKSLTHVSFFASDEDACRDGQSAKNDSFDYWSGFTERWPASRWPASR